MTTGLNREIIGLKLDLLFIFQWRFWISDIRPIVFTQTSVSVWNDSKGFATKLEIFDLALLDLTKKGNFMKMGFRLNLHVGSIG